MEVVKRVACLFLFILITQPAIGQSQLNGVFKGLYNAGENSVVYEFKKDGTFITTISGNLGAREEGKGTFEIRNKNELYLEYEDISKQSLSKKTIKRTRSSVSNWAEVNLTVFEESDSSKLYLLPIVHLLDNDQEEVMAISTDQNGFTSFKVNGETSTIKYLSVHLLGYHELKIDMNSLMNFRNNIDVYLYSGSLHTISKSLVKFKIEFQNNSILLTNQNGSVMKLQKIEN